MLIPKRHWATLLAIGLPLVVGACASGGMPKGPPSATAGATAVDALTLANRLKAEGNLSSAASMYHQAHQANPSDVRPLMGLAECLLAMGSNADAAQAYGSALAIQPDNLDGLRGIGHARILQGQPQFAITQYQTALKLAPDDIRALNGLGVAQDMVGNHAAAQQSYQRVLALEPGNQSAKNNLALSLALSGDNAGAITLLEELSKSAGSTAVNRQNLALVYGVSGRLDQAKQVSRADLPEDAVNRNIAAMTATTDASTRQALLKQSLGIELKGRQYAPAGQSTMPPASLAQAAAEDQPAYLTGMDGAAMPVIATGTSGQTAMLPPADAGAGAKSSTGDEWSDDWDEELVDAADIEAGTSAGTAAPAPLLPQPSTQPRRTPFLSSSNAIADDPADSGTAMAAPSSRDSASGPQAAAPVPSKAQQPAATAATATPPAKIAETPPDAAGDDKATPGPSTVVTTTTIAAARIYTVQLASYRSEAEATAGWQTLTSEQGDLLAKLPHSVAKADLGADQGIYYRLQAGAFSDRHAAKALCTNLQTRAIDCMVVEAAPTGTGASEPTQQSMRAPDNSFVIGAG